jgi:magnesium transporter
LIANGANSNVGNSGVISERRLICVSLLKSGKTVRTEFRDLKECVGILDEASIVWMDYSTGNFDTDAKKVAEQLGFSDQLLQSLLGGYLSAYEDLVSEMGLKLPAIFVRKLEVCINPLLILMRKNLVVTIHGAAVKRLAGFTRYAETFLKKIPQGIPVSDQLTMVLCRIIDENNGANFDHLRSIEEQGDELGKLLMDPQTPRTTLGPEIYKMKHSLITYLNGLWATVDVINSLRYGDAELLSDSPRQLIKVGVLAEDVNRQIELGEHMSEVLASGLEVLQSIYNNQLQILNNRMALIVTYLTVLGTAVLVPNTLATIFGSSAFALGPQDVLWYSLLLIFSTIISAAAAFWWIKRKKWLPASVDR